MSHPEFVLPDWARSCGSPVCSAVIREQPEDFHVEEILGIEPDGDGEHDFLLIEKTGANSAWVARQLARHAGVANADVGYAGLKDRNAVTRQTFSVRRPSGEGTDWSSFVAPGVVIVQIARHRRKIRRGAHQYNKFVIRLRGPAISTHRDALANRIEAIARDGVPNYFGEQRFGRNGSNVLLARSVLAGKRVKREQRSIAISAARSLVFNAILDSRVRSGSWNQVLDGELVNLDGSGSVFAADVATEELRQRCSELDIHPTASLWGDAAPVSTGPVALLEQEIAASFLDLTDGLVKARIDASHRPLRLLANDLDFAFDAETLVLSFALIRGAFATALLRELVQTRFE